MVEHCKVANCSNRLCDLPNELLLHILSFLEVKDAAQTSLSCKRWGQLWALVPDLHFKESDLSKRSLFLDFVERACALRGRLPMRAFSLNCEIEGAVVHVKKLIESVITSGVRDLSLVFSSYKRAYLLPSSIFTCASLEMLCVESFCLLKLPSICLPKLKALYSCYWPQASTSQSQHVQEFTLFSSLDFLESRRGNVPLFSNLIKLTLDGHFTNSIRGLWILLRRCPRLQNLCFNKISERYLSCSCALKNFTRGFSWLGYFLRRQWH
ncbi:unnamed protein product [Cuscuta campestris]|uniref:F-box domain-containing protein n=1 Tax=Cuscuta campestris TaxID=132261 RepID=A0A484KAA8_9ASTE|nr:unnamed protein product [Cuscuta campestris]